MLYKHRYQCYYQTVNVYKETIKCKFIVFFPVNIGTHCIYIALVEE